MPGGYPMKIIDPDTGVPLIVPDASPVALSDGLGNLAETVTTSGTGTAVNDVLFTISARAARSVLIDFTTGSGYSVIVESSLDGTTWRACPMASLSLNVDTLSYTGITINARRWWASTLGGELVRLRITTAGSGTLTAVARVSNYDMLGSGFSPKTIQQRLATGAGGMVALIRSVAALFKGYDVYNTAASPRFLQIYSKSTTPVPGTDTPIATFVIPATSARNLSIDGIPATGGLGYAFTTDYAGTTAAANGEVQGTLFWAI